MYGTRMPKSSHWRGRLQCFVRCSAAAAHGRHARGAPHHACGLGRALCLGMPFVLGCPPQPPFPRPAPQGTPDGLTLSHPELPVQAAQHRAPPGSGAAPPGLPRRAGRAGGAEARGVAGGGCWEVRSRSACGAFNVGRGPMGDTSVIQKPLLGLLYTGSEGS